MMLPPSLEELGHALSFGVLCLQRFDAFDRIGTSKCNHRIAAPLRPFFETAERLAPVRRILATPAPDREYGCEEFSPPGINQLKETRLKRSRFRVLATGIKGAVKE